MNITNPTNFGIPGLTLTTSNVEGTGNAVRTGASILAFDATDPAAVAASAVVGSATVASRRDHVHSGVGGAGTVVDEAITRFNGTGGASLQGYSSLSPTISDAGIISLTSGALKFPASAIASADANTLDDYELGSFSPGIAFGGGVTGIGYAEQTGFYTRIGDVVYVSVRTRLSSKGSDTGDATITGLPFTSGSTMYTAMFWLGSAVTFADVPNALMYPSVTTIQLAEGTEAGGVSNINNANFADSSQVHLSGFYRA